MGRALERRRRWFLPELATARRALVLGDGDGRFLQALLRANGEVQADYVDLSLRMLELAHRRAGSERVNYARADARTVELPQEEYDLVTAHFFFDCFEAHDLDVLIGRIAESTRPHARWVVSEFRDSSPAARWLVRVLYLFFRITTGLTTHKLVDHRPILESHGFRLIQADQGTLVVSELWER